MEMGVTQQVTLILTYNFHWVLADFILVEALNKASPAPMNKNVQSITDPESFIGKTGIEAVSVFFNHR